MENTIYEFDIENAHIFYMDVSKVNITFDNNKVSEHRLKKIKKLRQDKDKKLSLGAELLLIHAIEKYYPDTPIPVEYETGINGKPKIMDARFHFSLAHSGDVAVCAIADTEIGVDIEGEARISTRIEEKYFSADECKCEFGYIWTRKEAVAKATGEGIALGLDTFDVSGEKVTVKNKTYKLYTKKINGYYLSLAL